MSALDRFLVRADGFLPKERYTTDEFAELELERLWPRVWQIAGREEELDGPGDFFEYAIGDDSIVVVRTETGAIAAFHNACLHRGTRLADGCGAFPNGAIRCPYHALDATRSTAGSRTCPTARSSRGCPTTSRSGRCASSAGAGSCS